MGPQLDDLCACDGGLKRVTMSHLYFRHATTNIHKCVYERMVVSIKTIPMNIYTTIYKENI